MVICSCRRACSTASNAGVTMSKQTEEERVPRESITLPAVLHVTGQSTQTVFEAAACKASIRVASMQTS